MKAPVLPSELASVPRWPWALAASGAALLGGASLTAALVGNPDWLLPALVTGSALIATAFGRQLHASVRLRRKLAAVAQQRDDILAICDTADLGVAWLDAEGRFTAVTPGYAARLRMSLKSLIGNQLLALAPEKDRASVQRPVEQLLSGELSEYGLIAETREDYFVRVHLITRPGPTSSSRRLLLLTEDSTREQLIAQSLRAQEAQLRASERRLQAIFDHAPIGIGWLTLDGVLIQVNRRYAELCGFSIDQAAGKARKTAGPGIQPTHAALGDRLFKELLEGRRNSTQLELLKHYDDGRHVWVRHTACLSGPRSDERTCLISIMEEITSLKEAEAAARRMALYDTLTGLPNRRLLLERLEHGLMVSTRSGQFSALLFIDLDNFKHLNDARGHHVGDELLREIGQRLRASLREQDTVARLGGDEFVALVENLGSDRAAAQAAVADIAAKVRQTVAKPFMIGQSSHLPTASIGVTLFTGKERRSSNELLKEADTAMYRAKRDRDAVAFYSPELQLAAERRLTLERDLHHALGRDELQLLLQPQLDDDGHVTGAEALLRWNHPEHGLIRPREFLPVAEEAGLVFNVGQWVLREACRLLTETQLGRPHAISVNLSPRQIREPRFARTLEAVLLETGANPHLLTLELTEDLLREFGDDLTERLDELHALGVRLSVDDFGTGYSSLAYLKRLPLDEIKIERTFISDLPHDDNSAAIVEAILAMAMHLGLEVVAEGVEQESQLSFLRERGCRRFQGYLFGRPIAADAYLEALRESAKPSV